MHRAKQFGRITLARGRHALFGGAQQGICVGLPAGQDRLLVLKRQARRRQHVHGSMKHRSWVEFGLIEIDGASVRHARTRLHLLSVKNAASTLSYPYHGSDVCCALGAAKISSDSAKRNRQALLVIAELASAT